MEIKRVFLDTDPAIGVPYRDIDDGLAMFFLLARPEVRLEGCSITSGNVKARRGFWVAHEVLGVAGVDVPIYRGANSKKDLGRMTEAAEAMIAAVRASPGEISLLTVGPLTNVATAMMRDPEFAGNLRELVVMGGSLRFQPFAFFGEFNFHMDGRATSTVMSAPVPKTVLTMDLCSQAVFGREHLERIRQGDTPVAEYLSRTIPGWLEFNVKVLRQPGFYPWDPVAAAYLLDRSLCDRSPATFSVQPDGPRSGRLLDFQRGGGAEAGAVVVDVPQKLDADRFMEMFVSGLASL